MKRNVLNSPRLLELKKKRKRIFLNKVLFFLASILAVFVVCALLSNLHSLRIKGIEVEGNKVIDTEKIQDTAEQIIEGKYLLVFPKKNIFLYPKSRIESELHRKFPRLENINISIVGDKVLKISVTERQASYIWCGESLPLDENPEQKCYFIDTNGFIFDESPYFSGEVYFKFYGTAYLKGGLPSEDIPSSAYFIPEVFQKFVLFKETLDKMNLKPAALYAKENGEIKIFLTSQSASFGPEIIFKIDSDFQKVAENLDAALSTEPLKSDFKNKYSSLLYIDLRFGNKVFYKFEQ